MRKKTVRVIIEVGIVIVLFVAFIIINRHITTNNLKSFTALNDDIKYAYQIEKAYLEGDYFVISGWFFELKKVRNRELNIEAGKKVGIVLYDISTDTSLQDITNMTLEGIPLNVEYNIRQDVNSYFDCEYDYSKCGFVAKINKADIDLDHREYQIVIKPDATGKEGILSFNYLFKGNLQHIRSTDYTDLDVLGTDLEKIVYEGIYVAGSPEEKIAVYQYENKLYWIIDKNVYSKDNYSITMQYRLDTTQFDKIPEKDISEGRFWVSLDSPFETYEITEQMNCGIYRVGVSDIPSDFSVYWIANRLFVNKQKVYERDFRPIYNLFS